MIFRVLKARTGSVPKTVRQAWVGVVIETDDNDKSVFAEEIKKSGHYGVKGQAAIDTLGQVSPEAAQWYKDNEPWILTSYMIFSKDQCEAI